jgi:hypothetical protein
VCGDCPHFLNLAQAELEVLIRRFEIRPSTTFR